VKVTVGPFACSCLRGRVGSSLPRAAELAVSRYADRIERNEALPPPAFLAGSEPEEKDGAELELALAPAVEATLADEARRRDVPIETIVDQAIFALVTELEAGGTGVGAQERNGAPRYGDDARSSEDPRECEGRPVQAGHAAGGDRGCAPGGRDERDGD
jgi:hypothetical protein